jgi:hypothetical protein
MLIELLYVLFSDVILIEVLYFYIDAVSLMKYVLKIIYDDIKRIIKILISKYILHIFNL